MEFRPQYILDIDIQGRYWERNQEEEFIKNREGFFTGAEMKIDLRDGDFIHAVRWSFYMSDITGGDSSKWFPMDSIDHSLEMLSEVIVNKDNKEFFPF